MRALWSILLALALWQGAVAVSGLPPFLLPGPLAVARTLWTARAEIGTAALYTLAETLAGLTLGAALGIATALAMAAWPRVARALAQREVVRVILVYLVLILPPRDRVSDAVPRGTEPEALRTW